MALVRSGIPSPSARANLEVTPSSKASSSIGARVSPPSRIPPPSPPIFMQAKTAVACMTTPKRKPVPQIAANCSPKASVTSAKTGRPLELAKTFNRSSPQSNYGSTFIPQLKVPDAFSSTLKNELLRTSEKLDCDDHRASPSQLDTSFSAAMSARPLLQTFTSFFPLPVLSWGFSKPRFNDLQIPKPAFVSREKQLSRLKDDMTSRYRESITDIEMDRCKRCQGGLISL
ncbi:hypothetical protein DFH11DRAFT_677473 [Phellopilus nigrolimitatus]|nr:hypothetical protein DFH11DRAFT_677473 [Phellopilus nigrolimitatus]